MSHFESLWAEQQSQTISTLNNLENVIHLSQKISRVVRVRSMVFCTDITDWLTEKQLSFISGAFSLAPFIVPERSLK